MTKFWIAVASKDHVNKGIEGGFVQANHGKKAPMARMKKGDRIIYYSSKEKFDHPAPYQKFTAIGEVTDNEPYIGTMGSGDFQPFRRNVRFYAFRETEIRPLIPSLEFITDKNKWGYPFRMGFFEISENDYLTISEKMLKPL